MSGVMGTGLFLKQKRRPVLGRRSAHLLGEVGERQHRVAAASFRPLSGAHAGGT